MNGLAKLAELVAVLTVRQSLYDLFVQIQQRGEGVVAAESIEGLRVEDRVEHALRLDRSSRDLCSKVSDAAFG